VSTDVVLMFLPSCAFFADVLVVGHSPCSQPTAVIPFAVNLFSLSVTSIVVNVIFVWHVAYTNSIGALRPTQTQAYQIFVPISSKSSFSMCFSID